MEETDERSKPPQLRVCSELKGGEDEFEFHEDTGVLIVRDGPTDENGHDNAEVPEYVFRLEAIVATQLV